MSNSANPLQTHFKELPPHGLYVALLGPGDVATRRELEGLPPDEPMLTTFLPSKVVRMYGTNEQVELPEGQGFKWMEVEERPAIEVFADERCEPESGLRCPNPVVAHINGFSGPGYVPLCALHLTLDLAEDLGARIWRPYRVTLCELDLLLYWGCLG